VEALYRFQETVKDESVMEMMDSANLPIVAFQVQSWQELDITSEVLLKNLNDMNSLTPLAIQEKACPRVLTGNNVLVGTYTGSGKTLAF
jgi:superfamily II DNA/RNA helicase